MSSRYEKHEKLSRIGAAGQEALRRARVLIVGGGALGSSAADALVRAGVGHITIVDPDRVEESNLHRTALFDEEDIGEYKALVLKRKLGLVNSGAEVSAVVARAEASNIESLLETDLVVDGTDNMESRFLINDACMKHGIPWVYAGVLATGGNVMFIPPEGPCIRCLIPELPQAGTYPVCEETGVYGLIPQIIGRLAASEAIRYIVDGVGAPGRLILVETWPPSMEVVRIPRRHDCPACSMHRFDFLEVRP